MHKERNMKKFDNYDRKDERKRLIEDERNRISKFHEKVQKNAVIYEK